MGGGRLRWKGREGKRVEGGEGGWWGVRRSETTAGSYEFRLSVSVYPPPSLYPLSPSPSPFPSLCNHIVLF